MAMTEATPLRIIKGPYLQAPTRTAMTVMWETNRPCVGQVTWCETQRVSHGLNGRGLTLTDTAREARTAGAADIHTVQLTSLQPHSDYHYVVQCTDVSSGTTVSTDELPLRTAPDPGTPFSFAVTSETGGFGSDAYNHAIFAQIQRYRPDLLLLVGDAVARGSRYGDWERYLFGPGRDLLAHTPFYLCPGNHEENSEWMYRFCANPPPGNYYAFNYGDVQFVALDSTAVEQLQPGGIQHAFLEQSLAASRARWRIVFFHYPPYVSGDYQVDEMRALAPVLELHGVDLVFNSHTIVYERSHPIRAGRLAAAGGVVYVVAGGAGQMPQWWHHKRAWHTAQALAVPHFVQVVVAGSALELNAIDLEGRHFDQLRLEKHGADADDAPAPC
jgi:acid phosphatase type 7